MTITILCCRPWWSPNPYSFLVFLASIHTSLLLPVSGILLRSTASDVRAACNFDLQQLGSLDVPAVHVLLNQGPRPPECKKELEHVAVQMEEEIKELKKKRNDKRFCAYMGNQPQHLECQAELRRMNAEIDKKEERLAAVKKTIADWPDVEKEQLEKGLTDMEREIERLKVKRNEKRFCAYMGNEPEHVKCQKELKEINAQIRAREEGICRCQKKLKQLPDDECGVSDTKLEARDELADMEAELRTLKAKRNDKRFCAYMDDRPENRKCKEELEDMNKDIEEKEAKIKKFKEKV